LKRHHTIFYARQHLSFPPCHFSNNEQPTPEKAPQSEPTSFWRTISPQLFFQFRSHRELTGAKTPCLVIPGGLVPQKCIFWPATPRTHKIPVLLPLIWTPPCHSTFPFCHSPLSSFWLIHISCFERLSAKETEPLAPHGSGVSPLASLSTWRTLFWF